MSEKIYKVWFGEVKPVDFTVLAEDNKSAIERARVAYLKFIKPDVEGIAVEV